MVDRICKEVPRYLTALRLGCCFGLVNGLRKCDGNGEWDGGGEYDGTDGDGYGMAYNEGGDRRRWPSSWNIDHGMDLPPATKKEVSY